MSRITLPSFRLRLPRANDLDALQDLEKKSFTTDLLSRRRMRHWMSASNGVFLVCESNRDTNPIAGYILLFYRSNSRFARLYSLVVSEDFRGQGVARQLMAEGERLVKQSGRSGIRLEVSPVNHSAIYLYEALGYIPFAVYKEFYEDGGDAVRYEKCFKPGL